MSAEARKAAWNAIYAYTTGLRIKYRTENESYFGREQDHDAPLTSDAVLTVGSLREQLSDLPAEMPVFTEGCDCNGVAGRVRLVVKQRNPDPHARGPRPASAGNRPAHALITRLSQEDWRE